ncbi:hypothetical protein Scep_027576 [Stephania cephalantha]|uniref:Uncharacterized protein n=1 Tax=Stephania cephalantha TaxID=152367 RepID=A0AAP0EGM5_9MAGN
MAFSNTLHPLQRLHRGAPHHANHGCPHNHRRAATMVNEPDPSQPADDAPEVVAVVVPERCLIRSPCAFPTGSARKPRIMQAFEQLHQALNAALSAPGTYCTMIFICPLPLGK